MQSPERIAWPGMPGPEQGRFVPSPVSLKDYIMYAQRHIASYSIRRAASVYAAGAALCLILLGLAATATPAFAQDKPQSPSERYQVERAKCFNGRSNEDGATCLKEANAALDEDKKGKLTVAGAQYQKNAALRCQALPAAEKIDCERRIRGEGTVSGSAESGGITRELVVRTPAASGM